MNAASTRPWQSDTASFFTVIDELGGACFFADARMDEVLKSVAQDAARVPRPGVLLMERRRRVFPFQNPNLADRDGC